MEKGYKYLYLLKFKEEPLIKIGEGTKDNKSNYDRIRSHLRTYGSVFDLEKSYEVVAPKNYSISALERQLKDMTALFVPDEDYFLKYKGKDGATEIRKEESLIKILDILRYQQSFVDIKINQGISLKKKEQEKKKSIKVEKEKVPEIKLPFEYKDQKHLIELVLESFYVPNLAEVKGWYYELEKDYNSTLLLDTTKSFASKIFASDLGTKQSKKSYRDIVWGSAVKSDIKIKWIHHNLLTGKAEEIIGITAFHINLSLISEADGERCILKLQFDNSEKLECSEDLEEWKKWFENQFINPLRIEIPLNEKDTLKSIWEEIWGY